MLLRLLLVGRMLVGFVPTPLCVWNRRPWWSRQIVISPVGFLPVRLQRFYGWSIFVRSWAVLLVLLLHSIRKLQVILCVPGCKEVAGRGRRQNRGELSTWLRQGERQEANRVSMRRDVVKNNLVTENSVSRPPNSTNRTQKTILSPTKPNVHSPLEKVLNIARKYTERQQDIHQLQISVL